MQAMAAVAQKRAVGVIRVSRVGDREGERFISPTTQREAIERLCGQRELALFDCFEEANVSGGRPLKRRPGLLAAVEAIEAGRARVLVVAFFDRLARHTGVLSEVVERVEAAGGSVTAVDLGDITFDTPARWLSSKMLGDVAEYHRRVVAHYTNEAKEKAVARGVPPFPVLVSGYRRLPNGTVEVDPVQAPLVRQAFDMRAGGAPIRAVRDFLRSNGIPLDYQRTRTLLKSRFVLGELHHGKFSKIDAHPAIVEREVWQRVQRQKLPRGRTAPSERLLARLGVVRCQTCKKPMSVGAYWSGPKRVPTYRCAQPDKTCPSPALIIAESLEQEVADYLREANTRQGLATAETELAALETELALRQAKLQRAIVTLEDFDDVPGTRERLHQLRAGVEEIEARLAPLLAATTPARRVDPATEWGTLSLAERRDLIQSLVARIYVASGRGPGRVRIYLFGEVLSE